MKALKMGRLELFDCTPITNKAKRCEEIQAWLDSNPTEIFAILDDLPDAEISGSFFQTDDETGLTEEIADKVIAHLGRMMESADITDKSQTAL